MWLLRCLPAVVCLRTAVANSRLGRHREDGHLQGAASPGQGLVLHPCRWGGRRTAAGLARQSSRAAATAEQGGHAAAMRSSSRQALAGALGQRRTAQPSGNMSYSSCCSQQLGWHSTALVAAAHVATAVCPRHAACCYPGLEAGWSAAVEPQQRQAAHRGLW